MVCDYMKERNRGENSADFSVRIKNGNMAGRYLRHFSKGSLNAVGSFFVKKAAHGDHYFAAFFAVFKGIYGFLKKFYHFFCGFNRIFPSDFLLMLKKVSYLLAIFYLFAERTVFIPFRKKIRDRIPIVQPESIFDDGLKLFELYIQSQIKTRYKPCNLKEKSV